MYSIVHCMLDSGKHASSHLFSTIRLWVTVPCPVSLTSKQQGPCTSSLLIAILPFHIVQAFAKGVQNSSPAAASAHAPCLRNICRLPLGGSPLADHMPSWYTIILFILQGRWSASRQARM